MPSTLSSLSTLSRILNQPVPRALLKKGKRAQPQLLPICANVGSPLSGPPAPEPNLSPAPASRPVTPPQHQNLAEGDYHAW